MDPIVLSLNFRGGCLVSKRLRLLPNQSDGRRVMAFDFLCKPHLLVKLVIFSQCGVHKCFELFLKLLCFIKQIIVNELPLLVRCFDIQGFG